MPQVIWYTCSQGINYKNVAQIHASLSECVCSVSSQTGAAAEWLTSWNSSSVFPSYISGVHHFGEIFCACDCFFFIPTIEVVTHRLHGLCMLGVFLLSTFTLLGHDCQDLLSLWWNACVHRLDLRFILSSERILGEWSQNPCQLQGKNLLYWKNSPQERIVPTILHQAGQWAQHTNRAIPAPSLGLVHSFCVLGRSKVEKHCGLKGPHLHRPATA